ncbi:MAG: diacylglycerol kinase family protein [Bdellovibrionota bacterium]
MPGIGIIANPHSKLNKRSPQTLSLMAEALGQDGIFTVTRDLDHLDETLRDYRDHDIAIVGINGGDGSISQIITRMVAIYGPKPLPLFAVLRGGTMNLIASQLGVTEGPIDNIRRLVEINNSNRALPTQRLSTLKINDIYGFLYADQSATAILEEFYRKKSGHLGATWLATKVVSSFMVKGELINRLIRPHALVARFKPTGYLDRSVLGCFAGTITKFPLGFPFLPLARRYPGHFQVTAITSSAESLLWNMAPILLLQREGRSVGKESFCVRHAALSYEGEAHFTVDGEIYIAADGKILIEAGPSLRFVSL